MNNSFHIFILILLTRLLCYNRLILKRSRNEAICEFFSSHLHRLEAVLIDGWVVEKDADRRTHILGSQMANVIFETVPLIPIEWIPSFNFELRFKSCSRAFVRDELRTFWCSSPSTYICKNSLCISEKTHICKHVIQRPPFVLYGDYKYSLPDIQLFHHHLGQSMLQVDCPILLVWLL